MKIKRLFYLIKDNRVILEDTSLSSFYTRLIEMFPLAETYEMDYRRAFYKSNVFTRTIGEDVYTFQLRKFKQ